MAETQLLENGRNDRGCTKTAEISAIFKQSEHVGTTPKEEGLKLLENGRNSGQIIQTETLLENGRNFGHFQTNTADWWKTAKPTPKSIKWIHCWKSAEISAVFKQLQHLVGKWLKPQHLLVSVAIFLRLQWMFENG